MLQHLASLFPDLDLEGLLDESMPWVLAWIVLVGATLVTVVVAGVLNLERKSRSPVERVMRGGRF